MATNTGPEQTTGNMSDMQDEPGAVDNRLSLNPNDDSWADTIGDWQDGKIYNVSLKVRQISPGEFEVMEAEPENEPESPAEDESEMPMMKKGKGRYPNPAIENL